MVTAVIAKETVSQRLIQIVAVAIENQQKTKAVRQRSLAAVALEKLAADLWEAGQLLRKNNDYYKKHKSNVAFTW